MRRPIVILITCIVLVLRGIQAIYWHSIGRFPNAFHGHLDFVGWLQILVGIAFFFYVRGLRKPIIGFLILVSLTLVNPLIRNGSALAAVELVVYGWLIHQLSRGRSTMEYLTASEEPNQLSRANRR